MTWATHHVHTPRRGLCHGVWSLHREGCHYCTMTQQRKVSVRPETLMPSRLRTTVKPISAKRPRQLLRVECNGAIRPQLSAPPTLTSAQLRMCFLVCVSVYLSALVFANEIAHAATLVGIYSPWSPFLTQWRTAMPVSELVTNTDEERVRNSWSQINPESTTIQGLTGEVPTETRPGAQPHARTPAPSPAALLAERPVPSDHARHAGQSVGEIDSRKAPAASEESTTTPQVDDLPVPRTSLRG